MRQPPFISHGLLLVSCLLLSAPGIGFAQQPNAAASDSLNVEEIAAKTRQSLISISTTGRDGRTQGIGTGFIVDKSGLIATNLHVIGDARPFQVEKDGFGGHSRR